MIPICLTERTVTTAWDKEAQEHVRQVTDTPVYVNPEAIEAFRVASDAPEKYATHIRMVSKWDLFVVETPDRINVLLKSARDEARWDLEGTVSTGILDGKQRYERVRHE